MVCTHDHIHSINCILPPHMVDSIEQRGSGRQQQMAREIQKHAEKFREDRVEKAPATSFLPAAAVAAGASKNLNRTIYDGNNRATLPGSVARQEGGGPTGDADVDAAYDGSGTVYDLYFNEFLRDSLDGNGMGLQSTVHHRRNYNNAFWNGNQMAYGDGDGSLFNSFTSSLSIIGHELSHGVV